MASLLTPKLLYVGKAQYMVPACTVAAQRGYASQPKYLKTMDTVHMKRGRGGRSSFSGVICTVFGATGFLGRYVANRLGKTGTQMIFPYRCDAYEISHLKTTGDLGQVVFTPFQARDEESIARAVQHSHVVINLIGCDWDTRNYSIEEGNIETAERIARISAQAGIERFIHMSALNCDQPSEGLYQRGGSRFLKAKLESEAAVRKHFPDAVIFRPSDIFGSEDRFLRYYGNPLRYDNKILTLPKGGRDVFKQPIFVSDVAQGIVNAVYRDSAQAGGTFQCVGPHRYEHIELVKWILRVVRRQDLKLRSENTDIYDTKFFPLLRVKALLNRYSPWGPIASISEDKLEREAVTDVVRADLPTLEDLDVTPQQLERNIDWILRCDRAHNYMEEEVGDFVEPRPAPYSVPGAA